ncbi:hypothetical protein [Dendronalium sp. ChiSLP03b]|uniref:hypothetical protein n=1 Tax=Dendronalium sp. ChiSLP03b TaxID=3075381 RepID=UPI002AD543D7|nr:hypothetical protein [Dendronalium sp. ChiSLP03b]MDZ8205136.1 hypothetical protein [Dendronalium sp. ChiSLP03b]
MKRILIGALLALPLALASFPSQASAAKIVVRPVVKPKVVHRPVVRRPVVHRPVVRQRLIPGHWENTRNGRHWVPARYVRY